MTFNDTTTKDGLLQDCEFTLFGDNGYGEITSKPDRLLTFTTLLNRALDKTVTLILQSDGRWEYDDTNFTTLPIGTTNLVAGQQDYSMAVEQLKILRVEVLNANNQYYRLLPFNQSDIIYQGMTEVLNGAGQPEYYDVVGTSLFLYPTPQTGFVTLVNGLKVYFQREPSYFVSTDTTKSPGIATMFHRLVSRLACQDYAMARQLQIKTDLDTEVAKLIAELKDFYATRQGDEHTAFRTEYHNWQ